MLKAFSQDCSIELHCHVSNLPILVPVYKTSFDDSYSHDSIWTCCKIDCFTGFFNITLSDNGEGAKYMSDLAHGIVNDGVTQLEELDWEGVGNHITDLTSVK